MDATYPRGHRSTVGWVKAESRNPSPEFDGLLCLKGLNPPGTGSEGKDRAESSVNRDSGGNRDAASISSKEAAVGCELPGSIRTFAAETEHQGWLKGRNDETQIKKRYADCARVILNPIESRKRRKVAKPGENLLSPRLAGKSTLKLCFTKSPMPCPPCCGNRLITCGNGFPHAQQTAPGTMRLKFLRTP